MFTNLSPIVTAFLVGVPLFFIVGFVVFHVTDLVKILSRWVGGLPALNWIAIKGYGSYFTALVLAGIAVFYPGSALSGPLAQLFTALGVTADPNFVNLLTMILISLVASAQQNSGRMPTPLSSSRIAK